MVTTTLRAFTYKMAAKCIDMEHSYVTVTLGIGKLCAEYCYQHVCLSVCLSADISQEPRVDISSTFQRVSHTQPHNRQHLSLNRTAIEVR